MGFLNWLHNESMYISVEQRQGQKYHGRSARIREDSDMHKGWGGYTGVFSSLPCGTWFGTIEFDKFPIGHTYMRGKKVSTDYGSAICVVNKKDVEFV